MPRLLPEYTEKYRMDNEVQDFLTARISEWFTERWTVVRFGSNGCLVKLQAQ
jgi:hypothetical protein